MNRRHRVERAVGDHGYAPGWLVLDAEGAVITDRPTWPEALDCANRLALGRGLDGMVSERLDADILDALELPELDPLARVLFGITLPWAVRS